MNAIYNFLSSSKLMAAILAIFAIAIAIATFIENDFGTESARTAVYNARWFEFLILLGILNMIGHILKYKLYSKAKLSIFLFHVSFIVIILGAACTRYIGFEGTMSIREGNQSNQIVTDKTYINIMLEDGTDSEVFSYPVYFSSISKNRLRKTAKFKSEQIKIKVEKVIPNAQPSIEYSESGFPIAEIITSGGMGRQSLIFSEGDVKKVNNLVFRFGKENDLPQAENEVLLFVKEGMLQFLANFEVTRTMMADQSQEVLSKDSVYQLLPLTLYNFRNNPFVMRNFQIKGKYTAVYSEDQNANLPTAVILSVSNYYKTENLILWGRKDQIGQAENVQLGDLSISASYGANLISLPFVIKLKDFILERYAGSDSPSWFESEVELIDKEKGIHEARRIFMNNVLSHRGYKFYQSSYDTDELGTVLTVNYDWLGSFITYLGYLIMALGMVLSIFNKNSRFQKLQLKDVSSTAKTLMLLVGLSFLSNGLFASSTESLKAVPKSHADRFSELLVQDNGGRIKPLTTLSSEVLRKVSRKNSYKGLDPVQVLLSMMTWPEDWKNEPMIKIGHKGISDVLGIEGSYASFNDFFTQETSFGYALRQYAEEAQQKKPAYRSKFDNEVIRVDERVNVWYLAYTGSLLKIFPNPDDENKKWYSPITSTGNFSTADSVFTDNIFPYYLAEIQSAYQTSDWAKADTLQNSFFLFQERYGKDISPSAKKIELEIKYHKLDLFNRISHYYLLFGFLLLIIQFLNIFYSRIPVKIPTLTIGAVIGVLFLIHTYGLGLRWYISGHAPWSNGYEALTFISWGTLLAGFIFARKSAITISETAILGGLILLTAHLSWMDPQVTNLVPVLKSYWLVIHVAVITISYSFLGLGALLALLNLLMMFFQNEKNMERTNKEIDLLTKILELTLTVGAYLLSIGTFLGGVWANESWGRYWAWDPKETWALVTIIVYVFILHMRLVPGLKGRVLFNILGLSGFASVIMTYFGVNYYLSGLHSYAAGDPLPVPPLVFYAVASVLVISALAAYNQYKIRKIA